ncbi:MAG: ABC transporter substrate-binding protein [Candidatus Omnitrophica bacterium]|nr:ABC transporter substrate-binding protein [Candidatus Omnitrophota bacterium]
MLQKYFRLKELKFHWHVTCALIISVLSFIAGCHEKNIEPKSNSNSTLYLGTYQKPEPFIYPMITGGITQPLMDVLFNRLFLLTTDGRLLPELAEKWEILDSGKKFVIHLRRNVQFHDGVALTSRDVIFTLNWLRNPQLSNRSGNYAEIESMIAPDDFTLEITLTKPNVNFLWMALGDARIYPAHLFSSPPASREIEQFGKHPVGTGSYQFSRWEEDNTIVFSANPNYFEGAPLIQTIVVRPYSGKLHLFNAFVRGDVDFLERLDSADYETIRKDALFQSVKELASGGYALMFNFKNPVFNDVRVRRAVSMGLRRNEMIELLEQGNGKPVKDADVYEPEKALALIRSAGYKSLSLKLIVEGSSAQHMRLAKIIRNQLVEIGINVEIQPVKGLDFTVRQLRGGTDWGAILFIFQTTVDLYHFKYYLRLNSVANIGGYENKKLDYIFEKLETQEDQKSRRELFDSFNDVLEKDIPVCFLYSFYNFTLASKRLNGFNDDFTQYVNASSFHDFRSFQKTNEGG